MKSGLVRDDLYRHSDGAYFNQHAYLARVPRIDELRDGAGIEVLSTDRALLHETAHWYQYMGTSFGLAIGLHRLEQYGTSFDVLAEDDGSVNDEMIARRVAGEPLLRLDRSGNLASVHLAGQRSSTFAAVWHAQVVTDRMLTDVGALSSELRLPFDFEAMMGDFFIDVLSSPVLFEEPASLPQDMRACVKDVPIGIDEYLTTRAIMECAAVINEYISLRGQSEESVKLRDRAWRQLVGPGVYGAAVRSFCQIVECEINEVGPWLGSILLCCDIAMNPSIPPLVDLDEVSRHPRKWSEISPAWRFMRCAAACRELTAYSMQMLTGGATEFSQTIATVAGLEHWSGSSLQFKPQAHFLEELNSVDLNGQREASGEALFLSFFSTVATTLWRLRSSGDLRVFAPGLLAGAGMLSHDWFSLPPLLTDDQHERFWHPKPLSTPPMLPFVAVLMGVYSMTDILTGNGPLDFTAFPTGLSARTGDALSGLRLGDRLVEIPVKFRVDA